ncbi:MAG TPA: cobalt ECF transporter T component CbiQ [Syntrophomonadaceae bacterium]|nr:cobalt ECF transporter T component CbiQ [Syntrophomonadaceae bacterium]
MSKTVHDIQEVLAEDLRNEHFASCEGLLQKLDPRVKLLGAILLIIVAGWSRSIPALIFLAILPVALMWASSLPVWNLEKRIWGFIPLMTLLAAIPGIFSFFNPGLPILEVYHNPQGIAFWGLHISGPIYISKQGIMAAMFLFLRVGVSLSIGSLLILTTPVARLLKSIRVLRVPVLLVMTIEMSYRYVILLLGSSLEMYEARKMRTVGSMSAKTQRELAGSSMAALFARSMALSEEVYQSMAARGYTGEAVSIDPLAWRKLDIISLTIIIVLALVIVIGGAVFG